MITQVYHKSPLEVNLGRGPGNKNINNQESLKLIDLNWFFHFLPNPCFTIPSPNIHKYNFVQLVLNTMTKASWWAVWRMESLKGGCGYVTTHGFWKGCYSRQIQSYKHIELIVPETLLYITNILQWPGSLTAVIRFCWKALCRGRGGITPTRC